MKSQTFNGTSEMIYDLAVEFVHAPVSFELVRHIINNLQTIKQTVSAGITG